jgi:predicted nucleic acid-binding protein
MSKLNIQSIMLDTSFCIRLMDENDALHSNALDYFRHFLTEKIIIHLSTIAVAEYAVGDDPSNLPLDNLQIESFDFRDGETAGNFHKAIRAKKGSIAGYNRSIITNDVKILAQTHNRNIDAIISKDAKSYKNYIKPLTDLHLTQITFFDLNDPLNAVLGQLFV